MDKKKVLFNSDTNILGGVPDYAAMIQFAVASLDKSKDTDFSFRTENAGKRFMAAINRCILTFKNKKHKQIVFDALSSEELRMDQKLMVIFWQMTINNELFKRVTENYFMKSVYAGRLSLHPEEIMSYFYELRKDYPGELTWSDATLKLTASKYLTIMKKLGLAEGTQTKEIKYPNIGDELFVILVKMALAIYPNKPTEGNPLFKFSFQDTASLISRMKSIKFTPYWTLTQLGNNIKIILNTDE
jgi:hypothetical protein